MRVQLQIAMRKIICYFYFEQRCGRRRRRRRRVLLARTSNWNWALTAWQRVSDSDGAVLN